jgi:hypothetical protein
MDVWHGNLSALVMTVLVTVAFVWCISIVGGGMYMCTTFSSMTWAGGLYIRTPLTPRILRFSQRCHGVCDTWFVGVGGDGFDGCRCGTMVCRCWVDVTTNLSR